MPLSARDRALADLVDDLAKGMHQLPEPFAVPEATTPAELVETMDLMAAGDPPVRWDTKPFLSIVRHREEGGYELAGWPVPPLFLEDSRGVLLTFGELARSRPWRFGNAAEPALGGARYAGMLLMVESWALPVRKDPDGPGVSEDEADAVTSRRLIHMHPARIETRVCEFIYDEPAQFAQRGRMRGRDDKPDKLNTTCMAYDAERPGSMPAALHAMHLACLTHLRKLGLR